MAETSSLLPKAMKLLSLLIVVGLSCLGLSHPLLADGVVGIIPKPQVERYEPGLVRFQPRPLPFNLKNAPLVRHFW